MKRKSSMIILICSVVSMLAVLFLLRGLDDQLPIHWNSAGEIDGFGSKYLYLLFCLVPILILGLADILPKIDPKKKNYRRHERGYRIIMDAIAAAFLIVMWISFAAAAGMKVDVKFLISLMLGVLFICIGNYMPVLKDNYFCGIRTPWTLADSTVWRKTHRLGGVIFILMGIAVVIGGLVKGSISEWIVVVPLLGGILITYFYSYFCYKKLHKNEK